MKGLAVVFLLGFVVAAIGILGRAGWDPTRIPEAIVGLINDVAYGGGSGRALIDAARAVSPGLFAVLVIVAVCLGITWIQINRV